MSILLLAVAGTLGASAAVHADFGEVTGPVKELNGVNNAPIRFHDIQWEMHNANIPFVRTHDTFGSWGGKFVDIHNVFPDPAADENDPKSYDFAFTDRYLKSCVDAGVKVFYRLGETIENDCGIKAYYIHPPKDPAKWARICEHVVRHYNEGWADGFRWNIDHWEIWNEPENDQMWTGTMEQYFELYAAAARHLKACFPNIKVGGYASSGFFAVDAKHKWEAEPRIKSFPVWFDRFLAFVKERRLPLDFFSWHLYTDEPERIIRHANYVRGKLDAAGFAQTESILDEWNRVEFGSMDGNTFVDIKEAKGASFVAAAFALMQYGPVDKAMYYDALPTRTYCGLFYFPTLRTTPCYESFAQFGELLKLGSAVRCRSDVKGVYAVAAKAEGRTECAILLSNPSSEPKSFDLELKGGKFAESHVTLGPWGTKLLRSLPALSVDDDHGPVLGETPEYVVTPANGVWDAEYGRTDDPNDLSFRFKLLRYADGIGVKARVTDDRIATDNCKPATLTCPSWDDDNLECFFDGDNDRSPDARAGDGLKYGGEFTFVANGAAQSDFSGWPKSFGNMWIGKVTTNDLANGSHELVYDMFFTWGCLGRKTPPPPDEKVAFGFNICVHDDDDGGRNDHALYWKGNPARPYRDESQFGTIEF